MPWSGYHLTKVFVTMVIHGVSMSLEFSCMVIFVGLHINYTVIF